MREVFWLSRTRQYTKKKSRQSHQYNNMLYCADHIVSVCTKKKMCSPDLNDFSNARGFSINFVLSFTVIFISFSAYSTVYTQTVRSGHMRHSLKNFIITMFGARGKESHKYSRGGGGGVGHQEVSFYGNSFFLFSAYARELSA